MARVRAESSFTTSAVMPRAPPVMRTDASGIEAGNFLPRASERRRHRGKREAALLPVADLDRPGHPQLLHNVVTSGGLSKSAARQRASGHSSAAVLRIPASPPRHGCDASSRCCGANWPPPTLAAKRSVGVRLSARDVSSGDNACARKSSDFTSASSRRSPLTVFHVRKNRRGRERRQVNDARQGSLGADFVERRSCARAALERLVVKQHRAPALRLAKLDEALGEPTAVVGHDQGPVGNIGRGGGRRLHGRRHPPPTNAVGVLRRGRWIVALGFRQRFRWHGSGRRVGVAFKLLDSGDNVPQTCRGDHPPREPRRRFGNLWGHLTPQRRHDLQSLDRIDPQVRFQARVERERARRIARLLRRQSHQGIRQVLRFSGLGEDRPWSRPNRLAGRKELLLLVLIALPRWTPHEVPSSIRS